MPPKNRGKSINELMGGNKIDQLQHQSPTSHASASQTCTPKDSPTALSGQLLGNAPCNSQVRVKIESQIKENGIRFIPWAENQVPIMNSITKPGHDIPLDLRICTLTKHNQGKSRNFLDKECISYSEQQSKSSYIKKNKMDEKSQDTTKLVSNHEKEARVKGRKVNVDDNEVNVQGKTSKMHGKGINIISVSTKAQSKKSVLSKKVDEQGITEKFSGKKLHLSSSCQDKDLEIDEDGYLVLNKCAQVTRNEAQNNKLDASLINQDMNSDHGVTSRLNGGGCSNILKDGCGHHEDGYSHHEDDAKLLKEGAPISNVKLHCKKLARVTSYQTKECVIIENNLLGFPTRMPQKKTNDLKIREDDISLQDLEFNHNMFTEDGVIGEDELDENTNLDKEDAPTHTQEGYGNTCHVASQEEHELVKPRKSRCLNGSYIDENNIPDLIMRKKGQSLDNLCCSSSSERKTLPYMHDIKEYSCWKRARDTS